MDIVIIPILQTIIAILGFYQIVIFVNIVLTWVVMLGMVDITKYPILSNIFIVSRAITEPAYNIVRRVIPPIGGTLDLAPVIIVLLIWIISNILNSLIIKLSVVY